MLTVARRAALPLVLALSLLGAAAHAAGAARVAHPYILWTKDEIAATKRRLASDPDATRQLERMMGRKGGNDWFRNLFRAAVLDDEKAAERELKYLRGFFGTHPDRAPVTRAHYDCYHDALRYDVLHDRLTPEERRRCEDTFRGYIDHQLKDTKRYTRTSWLPNMQWPRPMAAHLMAAALGDETLIRKLVGGNGGWTWYFDEYIADGRFYMEEFGKHYSMIGEMLLFCRGLERLGLDDIGYGYTGTGGATMRNYVASILDVGYPRVSLGSALFHYPKVTMGDGPGCAKTLRPDKDTPLGTPPNTGVTYMLLHSFVTGHFRDGRGGNAFWNAANMNGRDHRNIKVPKMMEPLWFEIAHARWPDAGFDYVLAQMREPGDDRYLPTLYWGLEPIDPAAVTPPPAPSYVAPERGFAMLRAEEGPAYWEGEAPAVALNLGVYYVHFVRDYFSLLGFYAFNRPIYQNRGISQGYATGDPWTGWGMGKCTVLVDRRLMTSNAIGQVQPRFHRGPLAKFVAARTDKRWPVGGVNETHDTGREAVNPSGIQNPETPVDESRALVLTREYLLDVARLQSPGPHVYDWQVHTLGSLRPGGDPWTPTTELDGLKLYPRTSDRLSRRHDLHDVRRLDPGQGAWTVRCLQTCQGLDPEDSVLGPDWYAKRVGVRVTMLGGPETTVFAGKTPTHQEPDGWVEPEMGGVSIIARRKAKATTFAAVHEPFKDDAPAIDTVDALRSDLGVVAVALKGKGASPVDDRVLVATGDAAAAPQTVEAGGERFTFTGYGFVRVGPKQVAVEGNVAALAVKVAGTPMLTVNGKPAEAAVRDGLLTWAR